MRLSVREVEKNQRMNVKFNLRTCNGHDLEGRELLKLGDG
jgi:hypothetical protein